MQKRLSYPLVLSGLFVALGLIVPYFTSHAFGVPGTILLPMHIPILLCGLFCGPRFGAMCGIVVPILSSILTGMPPTYPVLPMMVVQLAVMGALSGYLYQKKNVSIYPTLLATIPAGLLAYGLVFQALMVFESGSLKAASVTTAFLTGLPGIAIQLTLIPVLVTAVKRYTNTKKTESDLLLQARAKIKKGEASCVVIKNNEILHTADGRGVSPLLYLYQNDKEMLADALLVDKIIGKAAAMILVLGGVKSVFGEVMSVAALEYLQKSNVATQFGRCVDVIEARGNKGICPIEKSVLDIEDAQQGIEVIQATIADLKKQAV